MISRHHCLCLVAVFPAVCAASFTGTLHSSVIHGPHLRKKTHFRRSEEEQDGGYPLRKSHAKTRYGSNVWYYGPSYEHSSKFTGTGVREPGMVSAGKKEDEQRNTGPVREGGTPLDGLGSPSTAGSLDAVLASASTPASSAVEIAPSSSVLSGSSSPQSSSTSDGQATHSSSPPSALATTSTVSASSSSPLQPALLAFILVPVCIFLFGMLFALYRIYGKPGSRVPPASPLFLGDTTARGSGHHRDEAISANEPPLQPRGSPFAYDLNKKGTVKWDPYIDRNSVSTGAGITKGSTPKHTNASHLLKTPTPVAGMGRYSSASRVLRPYVPRPYHRPHPAYTADPESVVPLILNGSKTSMTNNGQGRYAALNSKGNGKENSPQGKGDHARKHRDDISTTPLNTSPRSLPFRDPVISAVISDMDIRFKARTQPSSTSVVSMAKDKSQLAVPPLSSSSTSFDIGLAMMSELSSPNVGLGLNLSSRPPFSEHMSKRVVSMESLKNGSLTEISREAGLPYLEPSVTAGSRGLADLSRHSRDVTPPDNQGEQIEDELDVALALAVYKTQHAGDRLQARGDPVYQKPELQRTGTESQDSLVSSLSCETRYTPTAVKAPTLPTLSEMALSRADPLYESVTNELFSSYGMRMSIANGQGRTSRVSARISRMLSWFADPSASGNRNTVMENRMSCEDPTFSGEGYRERLSDVPSTPGGVQPLRIGKVRKNAV